MRYWCSVSNIRCNFRPSSLFGYKSISFLALQQTVLHKSLHKRTWILTSGQSISPLRSEALFTLNDILTGPPGPCQQCQCWRWGRGMNQHDRGDFNYISIPDIKQKPRVIMDVTASLVLGSVRSQPLEKDFQWLEDTPRVRNAGELQDSQNSLTPERTWDKFSWEVHPAIWVPSATSYRWH